MTLNPKKKNGYKIIPTIKKDMIPKTKLTPQNYEKLKRITACGFVQIHKRQTVQSS